MLPWKRQKMGRYFSRKRKKLVYTHEEAIDQNSFF